MSPEQVEGKELDGRSDIFSLGAVLYEMVTGTRAFEGKSQLSVASAILEKEPAPISSIKPMTPPALDHVIRKCLEKISDDRWQSAADIKHELTWISQSSAKGVAAFTKPTKKALRTWAPVVAFGALILVTAALVNYLRPARETSGPDVRAVLPMPSGVIMHTLGDMGGTPAMSPDGSNLVFTGLAEGKSMLFLRALNGTTAKPLAGTEGGKFAFWSSDGKSIGFFADRQLKRLDIAGGPPLTLAPADDARGGAWAGDTILYAPYIYGAIWRVSAEGGKAERVTTVDEALHSTHRWPRFLPDGKHFLYLAQHHSGRNQESAGIYVASTEGGSSKMVLRSNAMAFYSSGYLLFYRDGSLMAQEFDTGKLMLKGDATALGQVLWDSGNWNVLASASGNNVLLYQNAGEVKYPVVWFDRNGQSQGTARFTGQLNDMRLSPDGTRAAAMNFEGGPTPDLFVYDLKTGARTKLSFGQNAWYLVWSPDGKRIAFSRQKTGSENMEIVLRQADGSGDLEPLLSGESIHHPTDWTRDGKYLVVNEGPVGARQIFLVPMSGDRKPMPLLPSAKYEHFDGRVSPDGKWIAFASTEFEANEIVVTAFPSGRGKWQISSGGSQPAPVWRADSKALYFISNAGDLVEARLQTSAASITVEGLHPLFRSLFLRTTVRVVFDADPNGQRFIGSVAPDASTLPLNVVTNWTAELKKK
jgi:Tol biopolymer transport system component